MLFTNTDSLVYEIEIVVYEDFYENKNLFDFSDYPEDSKYFWSCQWKIKLKEKLLMNLVV